MYRRPSARKIKKQENSLNLIPILDSVFIFIFFLLMTASFMQIHEVSSDAPIISDSIPDDKNPLALTLVIQEDFIDIQSGIPAKQLKRIERTQEGKYDIEKLHQELIQIKKRNLNEDMIILEPQAELTYEELVQIMDEARTLRETDEALYQKDKQGLDLKIATLFPQIVFGNLMGAP